MKSLRGSWRTPVFAVGPLVLFGCTGRDLPTAPADPLFTHTADHLIVNSLADPGDGVCDATECTLREAINALSTGEISFAKGLSGAITLDPTAGELLIINSFLSITGPAKGIVIQRNNTEDAFRIMEIVNSNVRLSNLTISGGRATHGAGVSVRALSRVSLTNVTVSGNSAFAELAGDGVGGGIAAIESTLLLTSSTVADNSSEFNGAGIYNVDGLLTLDKSRVQRNTAEGSGGGIYNTTGGIVSLTNSTVSANVANVNAFIVPGSPGGGGIYTSSGSVTLANSTLSGNSAPAGAGGGIGNADLGQIIISSSTISGNSAGFGGGIHNRGTLALTNSTVSENSSVTHGGGVAFSGEGDATVTNTTVVRNLAGGISVIGTGTTTLQNSLLALNVAPVEGSGPDVIHDGSGPLAASFNLIGDGTGSGISNEANGNQVGTSASPIDPKIGKLASNGSPTQTHALMPGSPAIDAASTLACPATDQRGVLRPQGPACDIGSYERQTSAKGK